MSSADETSPPDGPSLRKAFDALVATLDERGIRYAIIGGLAVIQHARARTTDDIDALLTMPQVAMPGFFEALAHRGFATDLERNIREFRDEGLTIVRFGNVIVDLLQPVIPAYARVIERAIRTQILGREVCVCSAEGLIVTKLIAMRPQDEADIQDLFAAYAGKLDLEFIRTQLKSFTSQADPRRAKLEDLIRQHVPNVQPQASVE